ncbi:PucR family transcriptional regulator [Rhodococcus sp. 077-4]|uniref:PucR family transcriptional regulator n=1 Tax=Rhodococcus sp. 077-4 TaxID=2789271 RepID=UPI0039F573A1
MAERAAPQWVPLREDRAREVWHRTLQPLAVEIRGLAESAASEIMDRVRSIVPDAFPNEPMFIENVRSAEELLRLFAQLLEVGADPNLSEAPLSALDILRSSVWRNVPFSANARIYRLANEQVWRWLHGLILNMDVTESDRAVAVDLVTTMLMQMADRVISRADQVYEAEREIRLQGAAMARSAAIDEILADRNRDVVSLSNRLRYNLNRDHVGIIVSTDGKSGGPTAPDLTEIVVAIARANAAESYLSHPLGAHEVAGWFALRRSARGEVVVDEGGRLNRLAGVRVAVGDAMSGLEGFRSTHEQARRARSVADLSGAAGSSSVTHYRDVALIALCVNDIEHAARFVAHTLGRLAGDDEAMRQRARTLGVYLSLNRSRAATASALSVHPNTVSYRVRQAEEALGRTIEVEPVHLGIALSLLPAVRAVIPRL